LVISSETSLTRYVSNAHNMLCRPSLWLNDLLCVGWDVKPYLLAQHG